MTKLVGREREVCSGYLDGLSSIELSVKFHVSKPTILKILRKGGVARRSLSDAHRVYDLDQTAFSTRDENCEYWSGFLMADGYIQFRKEKHIPNIILSLSAVDDMHLRKYANYLKTNKPIYYYELDGLRYARLEISSKEIGDRLIAFGVVPRKSWVAEAKYNLENSIHFWRGVVDGDGCINITGDYPRLRVVGSKPLMTQLLVFIKKHVATNTNVNPVWYTAPETNERHITAYDVNIVGSQAIPIIRLLYETATVFLTRKNELAQGIISNAKTSEMLDQQSQDNTKSS